jgi:ABC-type molybdenum transport system ATPase subunit/photorepair protein PhrA
VLILDEPTNNLDVEAVEALAASVPPSLSYHSLNMVCCVRC